MKDSHPHFDGLTPWPEEIAKQYVDEGLWGDQNLAEWIATQLQETNDIELFEGPGINGQHWLTLSGLEIDSQSRRLAMSFLSLGLCSGDKAIMQMGNDLGFLLVFFALIQIGVIPVMALPAHGRREIARFAKLTKAKAWFASSADGGTDIVSMADYLQEHLPEVSHRIIDVTQTRSHLSLQSLLASQSVLDSSSPMPGCDIDPAGIALLLCSGGSTGIPKLIPRTHRDYIFNAKSSAEVCELSKNDGYLVALPAAHNFPLACPGILGALAAGSKIVMCPSPSPETAFQCIERSGATVTALVPPLVSAWLEYADLVTPPPSSLRLLQAGGAKLASHSAKRVKPELGCELQQVFGMAEGLLNFTRANDPTLLVHSSQGRPLCQRDEILVVGDDGHPVPQGQRGELWTRGPYTLRGYYREDAANRKSFSDDGFYRSGDQVRQLRSGHLVVEGRVKEVIRRGAETVPVETLESLIITHPDVDDVAIVGLPSESLGEQTCAAIVVKKTPGTCPPDLMKLRTFLMELEVARFMLPDTIEIVDQIPLTAVGKVARQQLIRQIQQHRSNHLLAGA